MNIELDDAEKLVRYALSYKPSNSSFCDSLAWVLYRKGKFDEAEKVMDFSIKHRSVDAVTSIHYLHAAAIKTGLKKYDEARAMLRLAIKLYDPDDFLCGEYDLHLEKQLPKALL